jgi:hypothetical protein
MLVLLSNLILLDIAYIHNLQLLSRPTYQKQQEVSYNKRQFDKKSGTGRGKETRKEG